MCKTLPAAALFQKRLHLQCKVSPTATAVKEETEEIRKILTNGSFGTLCGGRTPKSGLWPPDACIKGPGTALVHHCDRINIHFLVWVLKHD